jgi:hypothetical protein
VSIIDVHRPHITLGVNVCHIRPSLKDSKNITLQIKKVKGEGTKGSRRVRLPAFLNNRHTLCPHLLLIFLLEVKFLFYEYMIVFLFNTAIYVFLLEEAMYSYCCLCILIVSLCILIVVYVFILLSMYSYCCLCILRRGYPD